MVEVDTVEVQNTEVVHEKQAGLANQDWVFLGSQILNPNCRLVEVGLGCLFSEVEFQQNGDVVV